MVSAITNTLHSFLSNLSQSFRSLAARVYEAAATVFRSNSEQFDHTYKELYAVQVSLVGKDPNDSTDRSKQTGETRNQVRKLVQKGMKAVVGLEKEHPKESTYGVSHKNALNDVALKILGPAWSNEFPVTNQQTCTQDSYQSPPWKLVPH